MKTYTIRTGYSFVQPDGTRLTGGHQIELEDDVAAAFASMLEAPIDPDPEADSPEA